MIFDTSRSDIIRRSVFWAVVAAVFVLCVYLSPATSLPKAYTCEPDRVAVLTADGSAVCIPKSSTTEAQLSEVTQ